MNTRVMVMLGWSCLVTACLAGPRDAQWEKVADATTKRLPKTAMAALEPIIRGALADKAYAEAIKAVATKVELEGEIQGNKPEEKIARFQAAIENAPTPMHPLMEAILAHWYWDFFQRNRWRFMQRTQTAAQPGPDIQTWDVARILAEIDRHFSAALAAAALLQRTPVSEYDALLVKGTVPDAYRPTLFDFVAYDALEFYQTGEQGARLGEDDFEIAASSPIFGSVDEFQAWRPQTADPTTPHFKAIGVYQALLAFHRGDREPAAFDDADLARLTFGKNAAVGEDKTSRYRAALERFSARTAEREVSARALASLAEDYRRENDPAKAHEIATRGEASLPKSAGAMACRNLVRQIEAPSATMLTEHVWNQPAPTIDVTYRNITRIFFRAYAMEFGDYLHRTRWNPTGIQADRIDELLGSGPAFAWNAPLPPTRDFRTRTENLPTPSSLRPGFYVIIASADEGFRNVDNWVGATTVWVSDLALVLRSNFQEPSTGFVLNAATGEPIANATVRFWWRKGVDWQESNSAAHTDRNGEFRVPADDGATVVLADADGQAVASEDPLYLSRRRETHGGNPSTVFFTDRAIYRPGQAIDFKGIVIQADPEGRNYEAWPGTAVTVVFSDPNQKEIARVVLRTNDFGSFSGSFTAPRDRLTGMMTIRSLDQPGATMIRVEEYKRPKFQVELQPPKEAAKLGAPVTLTGLATAYTGAPIDGAKVKWRVERSVQLPYWCWWFRPPVTRLIAHGSAVTDIDGKFKIQFTAEPDRTVPARNEPTFGYRISAEVTESAGETRTQERLVRAGYTAIQAALKADEWQTPDEPVELTVTTTSLDGNPQPAHGRVTIFALKQPAAVSRGTLRPNTYWWSGATNEPKVDPSNPDSWELGESVAKVEFKTDGAKANTTVATRLAAGIYRAVLETTDRFGREVRAFRTIDVIDPRASRYGVKIPNVVAAPKWSVEPGNTFSAVWGTGYASGRAFVELSCGNKLLQQYWTAVGRTQQPIDQAVTEDMRGGFTVRVTFVRENRAYITEKIVDVPWTNKRLTVKWESFRSKLEPGQKETWTAVISGADAKRAAAEMVATLYDASLDQFAPHNWPDGFGVFRREMRTGLSRFQNESGMFQLEHDWDGPTSTDPNWRYRGYAAGIIQPRFMDGDEDVVQLMPFEVASTGRRPGYMRYAASNTLAGTRVRGSSNAMELAVAAALPSGRGWAGPASAEHVAPNLSTIVARRNLAETAFFYPHLIAGDDGVVRIQFTVPESLTQWKFLGFAHDADLRAGLLTDTAVTAKDLMVQPNPPRFLREGDVVEFTVKVSNQSDASQTGRIRLNFADAASLAPVDQALDNREPEQSFSVPPRQSRTYSWRIAVPDGMGFLTYKAVAASAKASDGEEGPLPVLSRRILVTESLPLPIRGRGTKEFEFTKLVESGGAATLRSQSLTVQMVSHPAWYAVMALPYLMEYPFECSEQVFNRYYANALAEHIADSDPKIRRIFDLWKNTPALQSPLEKNQDLKSVMLEETPWVRTAEGETQARHNVGLLFDANRVEAEKSRALQTLTDRQLGDGLWSWFPGGRPSEFISLYIVTGFGRLRHLGVRVDAGLGLKAQNAWSALDDWATRRYQHIQSDPHPEQYVPGYLDALYLYGRSFYLKERPVGPETRPAIDFYLAQARKYWTRLDCRQCQGQLALALQRFGDPVTATMIVQSLKERSVSGEEMGMYWRDTEVSWWWYRAPIETQAVMIEAFAEITHDAQAVEDCKVWLLKQKQTRDWRTTKATADAIYALLLEGANPLSSDALVDVSLGGKRIEPENAEAGTGFYEERFARDAIKPSMGHITVTKHDNGVSWGSVHWQYLEDMAKVTPYAGTPLRLRKTLWVKETTANGRVLKPVTGPVSVGDELVVRLELGTDRDMEFVHLKDQRGSGTEPVEVLSRYHLQDGLAYYQSTRDTATHFFIDYLPAGTYVFEYSTRVQLKGVYQTGIAEIQCMYAPEFTAHSESVEVEVK